MDVDSDSGFMATHTKTQQNYAKFYIQPVLNKNKTKAEGRDIYEDRVYILILCPGQTKTEVRRPMQELDKREYPQAWMDFQAGNKEPQVTGTPIEYLGLSPSRAKELRAVNIYTVEQMASCADTNARAVGMDFHALKNKAAAYVTKNSPEVEELRRKVADLTQKLTELSAKKPGRPRKQPEQIAA